jgi:hypothetical protein
MYVEPLRAYKKTVPAPFPHSTLPLLHQGKLVARAHLHSFPNPSRAAYFSTKSPNPSAFPNQATRDMPRPKPNTLTQSLCHLSTPMSHALRHPTAKPPLRCEPKTPQPTPSFPCKMSSAWSLSPLPHHRTPCRSPPPPPHWRHTAHSCQPRPSRAAPHFGFQVVPKRYGLDGPCRSHVF